MIVQLLHGMNSKQLGDLLDEDITSPSQWYGRDDQQNVAVEPMDISNIDENDKSKNEQEQQQQQYRQQKIL